MVVIVFANVTDTVIICIGMRCLVSYVNVMTAAYCVPVVVGVIAPCRRVGVSVIVVILANVTNRIIIRVSVKSLCLFDVVTAGRFVIVSFIRLCPRILIGVGVVDRIFANVTEEVSVCVLVRGYILLFVGVLAACRVPVIVFILGPRVRVGVGMLPVILAGNEQRHYHSGEKDYT